MKILTQIIKPFCLLALVLMLGCNSHQQSVDKTEVTGTDSRGKTIRLPHPAKRVVVLHNSIVDEVYMLQAGDRLVGIPEQIYQTEDAFQVLSKLDNRIKNKSIATPTYGGQASNAESIVGLKPDLVLTFNTDLDAVNQLEGLGIPVFTFSSLDEKSILSELTNMAKLLGKEDRAMAITKYVKQEAEIMKSSSAHSPKKVYYAWSKGRIMSTSGKGSLIDMTIRLSGAENACLLPMQNPNISAETMYKWNPDLIILWNSKLSDVYNLKELSALPAVKNKQVFVMSPSFPFDPHTVKFLLFAKQVRHWALPDYSQKQLNQGIQQAFEVLYGKKGLF